MEDGYYELAHAIIIRAVEDYRKALKALKINSWNGSARYTKRECETFFRSWYYSRLTLVDGEMIIERLNMEVNAL